MQNSPLEFGTVAFDAGLLTESAETIEIFIETFPTVRIYLCKYPAAKRKKKKEEPNCIGTRTDGAFADAIYSFLPPFRVVPSLSSMYLAAIRLLPRREIRCETISP